MKGYRMKQAAVFLVIALSLAIFAANETRGATFTTLHVFSTNDNSVVAGGGYGTNSDGVNPASLVISGNAIFGTAVYGGLYGYGTVFRMDLDGSHFTNLFNFNQGSEDPHTSRWTNNTGSEPNPGLVLISNTLYGTTFYGGPVLAGSVFKINTDGSGFAILHEFNQVDGYTPYYGLVLHSNLLYGTTISAGTNGYGNIFTIDPVGGGISFLYSFTSMVQPYGGLAFDTNGAIYGFGRLGSSAKGMVYRWSGVFSNLYTFTGTDGYWPVSTPIISGNTIFGVSSFGGTNGSGNVFRINTDGSGFTNLYSFSPNGGANTDGADTYDYGGLALSGNTFYGTAAFSGSGGQGTVWQLKTDGSGFNVLHSFSYSDGGNPENVVFTNGILYGVTYQGFYGASIGVGGIFSISFQLPSLSITNIANRAVVMWNDPSFSLITSTNVYGTYTNISGAQSPYTNILSGSQRFFRLQSN
jgi:uncharacterized repeat protein (TIGR03803 family)